MRSDHVRGCVSAPQIHSSPFITYVRFSYGPPMEQLKRGVQNLTTLIDKWKAKQDN